MKIFHKKDLKINREIKKIKILFFGLFLLSFLQVNAQIITVKGTITNAKKEPLVGVTVLVKGTKKGVATDFDGNYTINVRKDQTLLFTYVGFKNKEIIIKKSLSTPPITTINIVLQEKSTTLKDVVVTGYQKIKANEFAGSSVKLKVADIKVGGINSVDKLLQGKAAGVSIQNTSSVFGTMPKIRIRGSSSITGINEPLWVVDGVVLQTPLNIAPSELYSGSARNLLASALGSISPNDIEDINILKDATATALYGTKAVNGVIVITTKRAQRRQKLSINYFTGITINSKPTIDNFDVLNSAEEMEVRKTLFNIYQSELQNFSAQSGGAYSKLLDQQNRKLLSNLEFRKGLQRITNNNTDWFDVLFRNSIQQQHSISVSYGGEKAVTRASFNYLNDAGYTLGQHVENYTLSSSSKFYFSDTFSTELLVKYSNRDQINPYTSVRDKDNLIYSSNNTNNNPYHYASTTSRTMVPTNSKDELEYYKKHYADFNIINELKNNYIDVNLHTFSLQLQLNYKPIKDLNISLLANKATSLSELREISTEYSSYAKSFRTDNFMIIDKNKRLYKDPDKPSNALPETTLPYGGILKVTNARTETYTIRGQVDWTILKNDTHKLNVFGGVERIQNKSLENTFTGFGYIFDTATSFPDELALKQSIRSTQNYYDTSRFVNNQLSFYGSLNYILLKKYIVTASLRNDATNVSGTHSKKRFLPTWTVAGAWSLGKEDFMEPLNKVISKAKLRVSYGLRGNAGTRGPDLVAYYKDRSRTYPKYKALIINIQEPENQDLEFEKEHIFSMGIDLSLFQSAINITADYYYRKNFDLIGRRKVNPSLGYRNKQLNWAVMTNEGWEFSINSKPIKITNTFSWKGSFNIGYNKNRIVSNYIGDNPSLLGGATKAKGYPFQNHPISGLYAFRFAGLNSDGLAQYFNSKGEKVYGFTSGDRDYRSIVYQGSRDPLYSGGFNSSFTYKNFTLSSSFVFNLGNVVRKPNFYRNNSINSLFRDDLNITGDYKNRWKAKGNEKDTTIPRLLDQTDQTFYFTTSASSMGNAMKTYNRSNLRTIDASFLRVRDISFQYKFPRELVKNLGLGFLTTSVQVTNPFVFASDRFRGQDPEALIQGTNIPPIQSFTFNLNVGF